MEQKQVRCVNKIVRMVFYEKPPGFCIVFVWIGAVCSFLQGVNLYQSWDRLRQLERRRSVSGREYSAGKLARTRQIEWFSRSALAASSMN
jgi:hypothetical protein